MTLAADGLSLRLPSGRTLGHRSLRIYYNQNLRPTPLEPLTNSSTALTAKLHAIRARLNDPSEALIPVSGGSGGYGQGQQVMKVRNAGEARWAKNMARQGREWRAREAFKTRVGFVHNSQKRELMRAGNGKMDETLTATWRDKQIGEIIFFSEQSRAVWIEVWLSLPDPCICCTPCRRSILDYMVWTDVLLLPVLCFLRSTSDTIGSPQENDVERERSAWP